MKTKVIFRKYPASKGGEVIALFPAIPSDVQGRYCTCYAHVGQHGGADYCGVIRDTKPASEAEYAELKRELESYPEPYDLTVAKKATRRDRQELLSQLRVS